MVYFEKSQPAPKCLAAEKSKNNGTYRCEGVAKQLNLDFKGKCYLCELKGLTSLNIEHFVPHRNDREIMYSWKNLFLCCPHCNGVKNDLRNKIGIILNCTEIGDQVDYAIRYRIDPFPGEQADIQATANSQAILDTVNLLSEIYNGNYTDQKEIESGHLREKLQSEIKRFQKLIENYSQGIESAKKGRRGNRERILYHLSNESAFTAFKRWIVRDDDVLMAEFGNAFN